MGFRRVDPQLLAELLAAGINTQGETDNLGDGESLVLLDECPAINVVELAEYVAWRLAGGF